MAKETNFRQLTEKGLWYQLIKIWGNAQSNCIRIADGQFDSALSLRDRHKKIAECIYICIPDGQFDSALSLRDCQIKKRNAYVLMAITQG